MNLSKTKNAGSTILMLIGACLWITGGVILTLRPAGNPPHSFRNTIGIMPFLGTGILFLSIGMTRFIVHATGSLFIAKRILFFSSIFYAAGSTIRTLFIPGKWEPMMTFGFLGSIIGMLYCGIALYRSNAASPSLSYGIIAAALVLLCFNDQYLPWIAILFGLLMLLNTFLFVTKRNLLFKPLN
jgi:hypothetical protein